MGGGRVRVWEQGGLLQGGERVPFDCTSSAKRKQGQHWKGAGAVRGRGADPFGLMVTHVRDPSAVRFSTAAMQMGVGLPQVCTGRGGGQERYDEAT